MRAFWVDSIPDKGCTITLLNYDLALRNGIHIDRTKRIELYHAAGGNIFNPTTCDQQKRRQMANLVEQVDSSDEDAALAQEASALGVSRRVSNPSPVYRC